MHVLVLGVDGVGCGSLHRRTCSFLKAAACQYKTQCTYFHALLYTSTNTSVHTCSPHLSPHLPTQVTQLLLNQNKIERIANLSGLVNLTCLCEWR